MESAHGAAGWALLLLHCRTASWCCDERLVIVLECSVQAKSMLKSGRKARKELVISSSLEFAEWHAPHVASNVSKKLFIGLSFQQRAPSLNLVRLMPQHHLH